MSNSPRSSFHDNPVNVTASSKCQWNRNKSQEPEKNALHFLSDSTPKRTCSGSSLSTLTADMSLEEEGKSLTATAPCVHPLYATFQHRGTRGMSVDKVFPQRTCHYSLQRPSSSSANASPLMNGKKIVG